MTLCVIPLQASRKHIISRYLFCFVYEYRRRWFNVLTSDLRVYAHLNSISVIPGQPEVDYKSLCAMDPRIATEPRLRL